jgi:hypothetical protein
MSTERPISGRMDAKFHKLTPKKTKNPKKALALAKRMGHNEDVVQPARVSLFAEHELRVHGSEHHLIEGARRT